MDKIIFFIADSVTAANLTGGFFGGILGSLLTIYVAHRLALRRHRIVGRISSYNTVVNEIRIQLQMMRKGIASSYVLRDADFIRLRDVQRKKDLSKYDAAIKRYKEAENNAFYGTDEQRMAYMDAIDGLLEFTERQE